jgi:chromate transport protein ChrA
VNVLPGPGATQLGIFIGHTKAGLAGGILAGLCFMLPAFLIMLVLASVYVAFGALPSARNTFYGIGPVVVGIFAVSVYRLGKGTIKELSQIVIALVTVVVMLFTPLGLVLPLLAAGCIGIAVFHSRRTGLIAFALLIAAFGTYYVGDILLAKWAAPASEAAPQSSAVSPGLWELGTFFFKVGAFSFGGGLSMLSFIEEQVVNQLGWLTPREFVDGLALGQLTPGPILMLAAFIGFKLAGVEGAAVAGVRDLSAVVPDDALDPAVASQDEGPSMAQGLHARGWTGRDWRARRFAFADGPARRTRSFHLVSSCTNRWDHVASQRRATSVNVWWRIDWTAEQGQGVGTYSGVGKMMPVGRIRPIFSAGRRSVY